jgi:hypothetical protein
VLVARTWELPLVESLDPEQARDLVLWGPYVALLIELMSVCFFLFYLRGLARALEFPGFANDALAVIVVTLVCWTVLIPLLMTLWGLLWSMLWFAEVGAPGTFGGLGVAHSPGDMHLTNPVLLVTICLVLMWPFVKYCNLLKDVRVAILTRLHDEELERKKPRWPV